METVRLDKWLWAARFFKTRSLCKKAMEGGKVHLGGQSCKVSTLLKVGDELRVRQGFDEKFVVVRALSDVRGTATDAAKLYEETKESEAARKNAALMRKLAGATQVSAGRPTKRDRRKIIRFLQQDG